MSKRADPSGSLLPHMSKPVAPWDHEEVESSERPKIPSPEIGEALAQPPKELLEIGAL